MFRIEVHQIIARITSVFYRVGVWHRGDEATVGESRLKFFYSFYNFVYIISLITGALGTDDMDESIFLIEYSLIGTNLLVEFLYIIWRKKEIVQLLDRICCYSINDDDTYTQVKHKLDILMKFFAFFFSSIYFSAICIALVIPLLGSDKTLFFNIGFPLDWRNNELAYWMAFIFIFTQMNISPISKLFSAIVWSLMYNCGLRYEVLGKQIETMGKVRPVDRNGVASGISRTERDNLYLRDLLECVEAHIQLKELTNELNSFLSELLAVQMTTSAMCISGSIYSLAFSTDDTSFAYIIHVVALLYNIFDVFMIMHFGCKIESASDRMSYCLFQSDWVDRPQSIKKIVLFGEFLMKPQQLVILKMYPLNLETFMRIMNSAYSSFNILQNFK